MRAHIIVSLVCLASLVACSSGGLPVGRDELLGVGEGGAADGSTACQSAGGSCVLGNVSCAVEAPTSDQDCNPDRNPGGAFCCLSKTATDAGAGSACTTAGGTCLLGSAEPDCAKQAPTSAQDCNPDDNPGGAFCCLEQDPGWICKNAGGKCVLGNVTCKTQAPNADQDCNPDKNPGGSFCCLTE
jgi:hypothetical protein